MTPQEKLTIELVTMEAALYLHDLFKAICPHDACNEFRQFDIDKAWDRFKQRAGEEFRLWDDNPKPKEEI